MSCADGLPELPAVCCLKDMCMVVCRACRRGVVGSRSASGLAACSVSHACKWSLHGSRCYVMSLCSACALADALMCHKFKAIQLCEAHA